MPTKVQPMICWRRCTECGAMFDPHEPNTTDRQCAEHNPDRAPTFTLAELLAEVDDLDADLRRFRLAPLVEAHERAKRRAS